MSLASHLFGGEPGAEEEARLIDRDDPVPPAKPSGSPTELPEIPACSPGCEPAIGCQRLGDQPAHSALLVTSILAAVASPPPARIAATTAPHPRPGCRRRRPWRHRPRTAAPRLRPMAWAIMPRDRGRELPRQRGGRLAPKPAEVHKTRKRAAAYRAYRMRPLPIG